MWLLDVNLPTALTRLLREYGIVAETTAQRGWRELTNGALAEMASRDGFRVLLTRDRRFGASAGNTLAALPELAIVVLTLAQAREAAYLSAFAAAWATEADRARGGRDHRLAVKQEGCGRRTPARPTTRTSA
jgi:predicted nuclease of predicted toxin-antitoxin system